MIKFDDVKEGERIKFGKVSYLEDLNDESNKKVDDAEWIVFKKDEENKVIGLLYLKDVYFDDSFRFVKDSKYPLGGYFVDGNEGLKDLKKEQDSIKFSFEKDEEEMLVDFVKQFSNFNPCGEAFDFMGKYAIYLDKTEDYYTAEDLNLDYDYSYYPPDLPEDENPDDWNILYDEDNETVLKIVPDDDCNILVYTVDDSGACLEGYNFAREDGSIEDSLERSEEDEDKLALVDELEEGEEYEICGHNEDGYFAFACYVKCE